MNTLFLPITALTVSIDAFFCGFALGGRRAAAVPGACVTLFFLCLAAHLAGNALAGALTERVAGAGGLILVAVGLYNFFFAETGADKGGNIFETSVAVGIAVGMDGAAATLSLGLMGCGGLYVPLTVAAAHFYALQFGSVCARAGVRSRRAEKFPPLLLAALGIYKTVSAFL